MVNCKKSHKPNRSYAFFSITEAMVGAIRRGKEDNK
jgi:hypothetical protein